MSEIPNTMPLAGKNTVEVRIAVSRLPDGLHCKLDIAIEQAALMNLKEKVQQAKERGASAEIIEALENQVSIAQDQIDTAVEEARKLAYEFYRKLGRA